MELAGICLVSFLASSLTLYSGFGLGTILMPFVALFLPVPAAIAVTAAVHLLSKCFKLLLFWRYVDRRTLLLFGLPAVAAALPGALLLERLSIMEVIGSYTLMGKEFALLPVKLVAGMLLIVFAALEQSSFLDRLKLRGFGLPLGGLLSGFFGGLTGHQGAFRSAFLVRSDYSEREFIATNAAVAALVDATRLAVYGATFSMGLVYPHATLAAVATLASFAGTFMAARMIGFITMQRIRSLIAAMMYLLGVLLCAGMI